ncbi:hypothetical protein CRUP_029111 [Coryphaenoides rupestris]|nr:hypothetical protein CRUP_029111 [Coryphaenoides rupestris]
MAVIIEYPDTVAARQLALLNMPFPDLVKYCVLSVSLLLLLLALIIFLWQLLRCCQQTNAAPHTSDYYLESSTTPDFLVAPRTMVSGSLRFIVFYEPPPQSRLVVTILQAEGLPRRSQAHKPHPFVRLRLMWAGQEDQEEGSGSLMMKKKKKEEEVR